MKPENMSLVEFWDKVESGELQPELNTNPIDLEVPDALKNITGRPAAELTHKEVQDAARELRDYYGIPMGNISKTKSIRNTWASNQDRPSEPELAKSDYMDS